MFRSIQACRAVWVLSTALLVVAACNPALACEPCPLKTRNTSHCAEKGADTQHNTSHETATVGTEQTDQCSHCITYLPSQSNSSRAIVVNAPSHGIVADYPAVVAVRFSTSTNPVEIHDHGPPGRSNPRYVLNSTFRI
ncbi:MAG TPA: hypothetical protein VN844_15300 [Pyrinomonadaceae bacterium]|nr:hypothetical protein [Pyrinomonadaceae bacterium]